jgi:hypothetical protein
LSFPALDAIGIDGTGGTGQRFIQPRKPEQLFTARSVLP